MRGADVILATFWVCCLMAFTQLSIDSLALHIDAIPLCVEVAP